MPSPPSPSSTWSWWAPGSPLRCDWECASMSDKNLVVAGVHKRLGEKEILKGVSFELQQGEGVALLGASGGGKTTLLRAIAGLDHPHQGRTAPGDPRVFDSGTRAARPPQKR